MTTSIREQLLRAVMATLEPVVLSEGARLIRSPTIGVVRELAPTLLLNAESDQISDRPNDRVERQLVIRLVAVARETDAEPAEACADRILVAAHRALFANSSLGGLCLGLRELETEWDIDDADATAVAMPARYQLTYRTLASDLAVQG